MAENRVSTHDIEVGIQRATVPGDARVSTHVIEVALLAGVTPGPGRAYVSAIAVEVGIWTGTLSTGGLRSRAFLME